MDTTSTRDKILGAANEARSHAPSSVPTIGKPAGNSNAARGNGEFVEPSCTADDNGKQLCIECGQYPRAGSGRLTRCWACIKATVQRDLEARERRRANTTKGSSS